MFKMRVLISWRLLFRYFCQNWMLPERMLNVTHTETINNADLYVMDDSPFAVSQMSRRKFLDVEDSPNF
ncbi:hypothetical protein NIES4071_37490 [Calothrix sp. NIES-4071]|nr:hypothetical protein NIES4071_37490 [Calothrix sp. NIES-4071]BAZ58066.1 hypothetical protein NIES4105_37420 [Calothrix sp. NIES-4105]